MSEKKKNFRSKSTKDDELASRKALTFEQVEGAEALPTQLQRGVISPRMRALLWNVVHAQLANSWHYDGGARCVNEPWATIAYDKFLERDHRMADDFSDYLTEVVDDFRQVFEKGTAVEVLGLVQWILRHPNCPDDLPYSIQHALEKSFSAYKVIDNDTLMPVSSEQEANSVGAALADVSDAKLAGPKTHLRAAADELTNGNWAASIRESINAVEAVARIIEPGVNSLGPALTALEKKHPMHGGLRNGFASLYGFTSDENGIRHALLEKGAANVDAVDAQYMLGACASFISYLLARHRAKA